MNSKLNSNRKRILMLVFIAVMSLAACGNRNGFQGEIAADETYYDMTFDWLNTSYTYDMFLKQGDSIEVFLEKERGKVSVVIQIGEDDPVYQGNDMAPSSFAVNIKETGNYTVKISGQKAKGHISISRQEGLQCEDGSALIGTLWI